LYVATATVVISIELKEFRKPEIVL
jgi:hypothetical protein